MFNSKLLFQNRFIRLSTSARTNSSLPRPRGVRSADGPLGSSDSWISWMIVWSDSRLDDFFKPSDGPKSVIRSSASRLNSEVLEVFLLPFTIDSIDPIDPAIVFGRPRRSRSSRNFLFRWYVSVSLASRAAWCFSDILRRPMASRLNGSTGGFVSSDNWLEYVVSHGFGDDGDIGICLCMLLFESCVRFKELSILKMLEKWFQRLISLIISVHLKWIGTYGANGSWSSSIRTELLIAFSFICIGLHDSFVAI